MREHGLQPPQGRRFAVTAESDHDQPILPALARELVVNGPNQRRAADLTYAAAVGSTHASPWPP